VAPGALPYALCPHTDCSVCGFAGHVPPCWVATRQGVLRATTTTAMSGSLSGSISDPGSDPMAGPDIQC
jgi:hypothetical protein